MTLDTAREGRSSLAFISFLVLVFTFGGLVLIHQYNGLADARQTVRDSRRLLADVKSAAAEAREQIFKLTDLQNIESFAESRGLVLEKNPVFITPTGAL